MSKHMCSGSCPCRTKPPAVPRVASSLDDLRVGQVIVQRLHGNWDQKPITLIPEDIDGQVWFKRIFDGSIVILSDPPPEPVTVSRKAFDRLAEQVDDTRQEFATKGEPGSLLWTAGSVVDEVRGKTDVG